jgi:hypothetical protein
MARTTASFVVDPLGSVVTEAGSSKGLGNESDLRILKTLRQHAEVVLTSGLTARIERYRMPAAADLAIFTEAGISDLALAPKPGQHLVILSPPDIPSYESALERLLSSYSTVHVEFGPQGFREVLGRIDLVVVSGKSASGVREFVESFDLVPESMFELPELFVTLAVGRGRASKS